MCLEKFIYGGFAFYCFFTTAQIYSGMLKCIPPVVSCIMWHLNYGMFLGVRHQKRKCNKCGNLYPSDRARLRHTRKILDFRILAQLQLPSRFIRSAMDSTQLEWAVLVSTTSFQLGLPSPQSTVTLGMSRIALSR